MGTYNPKDAILIDGIRFNDFDNLLNILKK